MRITKPKVHSTSGKKEIDSLLGENAPLFNHFYGVVADGNAPPGSDPHGELTGTNTLNTIHKLHEPQSGNLPVADYGISLILDAYDVWIYFSRR